MIGEKYIDNINTNLKIFDILDNNGKFLTFIELKQKTACDMSQMKYNSLISAIPNTWKGIIKE